jgi:2-polyprenyl-3-methyl-5-hydroxy-6-metoxy-1,4-benzoquinol methylase
MITEQAMRTIGRKLFRGRGTSSVSREPLMYRVHLFDELLSVSGQQTFQKKRLLEIGPKDGLDSKRLASLQPSELVMIDLPEKKQQVVAWLSDISCPHKYIEANFMYLPQEEYLSLGKFDLIWCTGVLYHNAEQLRLLRKLYKLLNSGGYLVLESATLRLAKSLRDGCYVEIHYPETYRNTGTITHLPTANAIKTWLRMVGFPEIYDSSCFEKDNRDLVGQRYACICKKTGDDEADIYYGKSGLNPEYRFGDST